MIPPGPEKDCHLVIVSHGEKKRAPPPVSRQIRPGCRSPGGPPTYKLRAEVIEPIVERVEVAVERAQVDDSVGNRDAAHEARVPGRSELLVCVELAQFPGRVGRAIYTRRIEVREGAVTWSGGLASSSSQ